jgi:hypothetical protein
VSSTSSLRYATLWLAALATSTQTKLAARCESTLRLGEAACADPSGRIGFTEALTFTTGVCFNKQHLQVGSKIFSDRNQEVGSCWLETQI